MKFPLASFPPNVRPLAAALLALCAYPIAAQARVPEIPHEKFTLENGLEILLHQDLTVPTVHIELWYKVGSKDEEPGRTGFAHLFEHIMFQGSKHIPEDTYFKYLAEAGASERNGSTSTDRTNYFETLPAHQLELGLWLESSRMGFLLERADFKATLDNQRDVVKNERRQRVENAPMGGVWEVQLGALYPRVHPYHHEIIGSMDDLSAAKVGDIRAFFNRYYAPNNAVLALSGNFDTANARALIQQYFAPIPSGPPVVRRPTPAAALTREARVPMEAQINLPSEFITWHTVPRFAEGEAELDVLATLLANGKSSRLQKRLVHELKIAQDVQVYQQGMLLAGTFEIAFSPLPGHSLAELEAVIDEEIEKVKSEPVSERELARVKNQYKTEFFRGLEQIQGRAAQLLNYHYFAGDSGFIARDLARYEAVTTTSLRRAAQRFLRRGARLVITVDANPAAPIMGRIKPSQPAAVTP